MYVMSYFRTEAEALHLAVSNDGLNWRALNENRPVLAGAIGAKPSLRDPFVFRAADGVFHLLATNGWRSDSVVHAVSHDLIAWGEQTLLPVMEGISNVRNCWAPECFHDIEAGVYRLIWSSSTGAPNGTDDWDHRIYQATTSDFRAFTPAERFFDPGYSVIDASVARAGAGRYLMAFKDERGDNPRPDRPRPATDWKAIRVCVGPSGNGPWAPTETFVTPSLTEGPTLFRRPDGVGRWLMLFDHFWEGRFGAVQSDDDGETWTPVEEPMHFPPGARHASVFSVDEATGRNLLGVYDQFRSGWS